jgi:hypothetical protein
MGRSVAAAGISAASDTLALSRGMGGGEEGTDRWAPGGSNRGAGAVMDRCFAHWMGRGAVEAGQRRGNSLRCFSLFEILFPFKFLSGVKIN